MIKQGLLVLLSTLFTSALGQLKSAKYPNVQMYTPTHPQVDNSTFANVEYVQDYHIHLDWDYVFWNNSTILGSITHELRALQATDYVTFDVWNLTIINVTSVAPGSGIAATKNGHRNTAPGLALNWSIKEVDPGSGQVLTIELP